LASSKNNHNTREACPDLPEVQFTQNHCYWIDNNYYSESGKANQIGGMLGLQTFALTHEISEQWLKILILGQYTGVGQRRVFGLGRYILELPCGNSLSPEKKTYKRVYPAQSILSEILDKENLDQALAHNHQDEYDDEDPDDGRLERIVSKIQHESYQPPTLNGYLIDKNSGGQRLLMVPPFWDRVIQRSFAQVLAAKLEAVMSQHSYGFRRGRSRITAKFDIQLAWREGYRWVYETDIKDFFNLLDIGKLMIRLQGLFYNDPCLVWIEKWMRAPLNFEGKKYQRSMGLPQGSPLSPVLANLFLDDFDNDMKAHGFRLVRFADDFVILCKSREQAQLAAAKVEHSLAEHGLSLNKEKTSIRTMEQGFYYLGYLFVNDMVLEAKAPYRANDLVPAEIAERFHLSEPQAIKQLLDNPQPDKNILSVMTEAANGNDNGTFLCVQGKPKWLSLTQGRIQVMEKDNKINEQPLSYIQAIILMGKHQISTQAMHSCMEHNVPIYFTSTQGRFIGSSWSYQPQLYGPDFWLRQQMAFTNPDNSLRAARLIVKARINSQWEVLRQRQCERITEQIRQIKNTLNQINHAVTLTELNGLEGTAGRTYFSALTELIPESFNFTHRNRRPPKDPVNILLSLGYTILYNYVDSFLRVNGLFPWLGLYHQPRSGYSPLAADLMEPHRYLVERCVLSAIGLKKIKAEDFFQSQDGLCRIKDEARKKYLQDLILRFDAKVKGKGDQKAENLISHLTRQNHNIALWVRNEAELQIWSIR
jgi:group II intron reverse transcriptase/maturase/CRISPR-associated endonuclease Cas1